MKPCQIIVPKTQYVQVFASRLRKINADNYQSYSKNYNYISLSGWRRQFLFGNRQIQEAEKNNLATETGDSKEVERYTEM